MAVKFARAFGARVIVYTTSPHKRVEALRLGAHEVVVSTDAAAMQQHFCTLDFILDTVSAPHDLNAYLEQLTLDSTLTMVGAPATPIPLGVLSLLFRRRQLASSIIGGIQATQKILDFCTQHGIAADTEMIPIQKVNEAYARIVKNDVKCRFVIDIATLKGG